MKKAFFLDRDGVINDNSLAYYIFEEANWHYTPGLFEALRLIQENGFQIFIVSNQGGISKGLYTNEDVLKLHDLFVLDCKKQGVEIQDIAFCPHHSDIERCLCRKPGNLLLQKLVAKYQLDPEQSVLIGDSERDIIAGESLGISSYLVKANEGILTRVQKILSR